MLESNLVFEIRQRHAEFTHCRITSFFVLMCAIYAFWPWSYKELSIFHSNDSLENARGQKMSFSVVNSKNRLNPHFLAALFGIIYAHWQKWDILHIMRVSRKYEEM